MIINMFFALLILSLLIFIHELGHFFFMRLFKVRVEVFSIGFGKALWSWVDRHGTKWSIAPILLGGYVRALGHEMVEPQVLDRMTQEERAGAHAFKPRWQKILIALGGPLANLIFAFIFAFFLFFYRGIPMPSVGALEDRMPAAVFLQSGDVILSVQDRPIQGAEDILKYIKAHPGEEFSLKFLRQGKVGQQKIKPVWDENLQRYRLGLAFKTSYLPEQWQNSLTMAWKVSFAAVPLVFVQIYDMIVGKQSLQSLSGPVEIVKSIGQAAEQGFSNLLMMMIILSTSLAAFNLLPLPVLDGGYVFLYIIEIFLNRSLSNKIKGKIFLLGWIVLFVLILLVSFKDIFLS